MLNLLIPLLFLTATTKPQNPNSYLLDKEGRVRVYHGVNIVYKTTPYHPELKKFDPLLSLSKEDYQYLKNFGFNVVRFGIIWEAVEISPGIYDKNYLKKIKEIMIEFKKNHIFVIFDSHQDLFTRLFCGEGTPKFYAKLLSYKTKCDSNVFSRIFELAGVCIPLSKFNWDYDDEGMPLLKNCMENFRLYHQSPELTTMYQSFYDNMNGVQDRYIDYWKVVMANFKDFDNIIGFDLWNEPFPGNVWSNPSQVIPGHADNNQILPFYKKLDKELRKINKNFNFMFQATPFPDVIPFLGGLSLGYFKNTPNDAEKKNQTFNTHLYCCAASLTMCEKGEPSFKDASTICKTYHKKKLKADKKNADLLQVPLIITEFGACSDTPACYQENINLVEAADQYFTSWTYWQYKPYNDYTTSADSDLEGLFYSNGDVQVNKVLALSRPYFMAYQGTPSFSQFFESEERYETRFVIKREILANSVLFVNDEYFYVKNGGFEVFVACGGRKQQEFELVNYQKFYYEVKIGEGCEDGEEVTVEVRRKK